ncbi:MAG: flagellar biosynthesis protein [Selenomonas ruminantium]|jgi:flagellar operon protein|uniref:Flagellar biosynthesis protein n=2 Tax=Selenomonas ruminantium TaxID=971 RepID=A0A927WMY7_SELRU|nr:flagellar biosynthesis protein [Selenomonas ruminantium]
MKAITKVPIRAEQGMAGNGRGQGMPEGKTSEFARDLRAAEVKFSAHAQKRMQLRGVELTDSDRDKLTVTIDRMAEKGAKDALILMKETALVVSVKNRTIITAVDEASAKENIFTNIDSAAIL